MYCMHICTLYVKSKKKQNQTFSPLGMIPTPLRIHAVYSCGVFCLFLLTVFYRRMTCALESVRSWFQSCFGLFFFFPFNNYSTQVIYLISLSLNFFIYEMVIMILI